MTVKVDVSKCDGCATCEQTCPMEAIKVVDGKAKPTDDCADCGACIDECPKKALELP